MWKVYRALAFMQEKLLAIWLNNKANAAVCSIKNH
jgi:hypothetical protein